MVSQEVLEEWQDTATANQCHEDSARCRCIFAQSFGCKIEDQTLKKVSSPLLTLEEKSVSGSFEKHETIVKEISLAWPF